MEATDVRDEIEEQVSEEMEAEDAAVQAFDEETAAPGHDSDDLAIEGDSQLSFEVGGKEPTSGVLTVKGPLKVDGSFHKGERLTLHVELQVDDVGFKDERDGTYVTGCTRRHSAFIVAVRRV